MPLQQSPDCAVLRRAFYSLVFGKTMEIVLENTNSVNMNNLNLFLQNVKKGVYKELYLNSCIRINIEKKEIYVRGYELNSYEGWTLLTSTLSDKTYVVPIDFDQTILLTTLDYFYHMMSSN